jgi:hypothetical protein
VSILCKLYRENHAGRTGETAPSRCNLPGHAPRFITNARNPMLQKINLNCRVKVKLTDRGKAIYLAQFQSSTLPYPDMRKDSNGYTEFQLWHLMATFGEYMTIGIFNIFESTEMLIDEKDIESVPDSKLSEQVICPKCGSGLVVSSDNTRICSSLIYCGWREEPYANARAAGRLHLSAMGYGSLRPDYRA